MKLNSVLTLLFIALFTACKGGAYDLSGYGLKPDTGENASPLIAKALQEIAAEVNFDTVRILLPKGRYDFYAYCHFLQMGRPVAEKGYHGWKDFIAKNPDKVKR